MLRKKTKHSKPPSPWTFRADATTLAIWRQLELAHRTLNASQIINDAIHLFGADATRLFLLQEKAKINVSLAMLATRATKKVKPQPPAVALAIPQLPVEAIPSDGASGDAMKAIETP